MWYKLKTYLRNIWQFRTELSEWQSWDYSYNYVMLRKQLLLAIEQREKHGHTLCAPRQTKQMRVCVHLLDRIIADEYHDMYMTFTDKWITEKLDNGFTRIVDTGIRRKPNIPAVVNEHKRTHEQMKQDVEYLHRLMAKHSLGWWD